MPVFVLLCGSLYNFLSYWSHDEYSIKIVLKGYSLLVLSYKLLIFKKQYLPCTLE